MKKIVVLMSIFAILAFSFAGCNQNSSSVSNSINNEKTEDTNVSSEQDNTLQEKKLNVVVTTTMLKDLLENIGKDHINVESIMGVGIDPHMYNASSKDTEMLQNADVVVYHGLHLEGRMNKIFENLSGKNVISAENALDKTKLIKEEEGVYDPHIWFNVDFWIDTAKYISEELEKIDQENAKDYKENTQKYIEKLQDLDKYIENKVNEIPKESRVLITAHDAFHYFANKYGFEVKALQGISTDSESGTRDIQKLADFIVKHKIKAIFTESSVSEKDVKSLQEAVKARGFEVSIGGELYSDSLGDESTNHGTYIETCKANIDVIANALR